MQASRYFVGRIQRIANLIPTKPELISSKLNNSIARMSNIIGFVGTVQIEADFSSYVEKLSVDYVYRKETYFKHTTEDFSSIFFPDCIDDCIDIESSIS